MLLARKLGSAASLFRRKGFDEVLDLARLRGAAFLLNHRRVPTEIERRAHLLGATLNRFSGLSALAIGPAEARAVRDAILVPYLRHRFSDAAVAARTATRLSPVEIAVAADALRAQWDFEALAAALPAWTEAVAGTAFAQRMAQVARRTALRLGRLRDAERGLDEEPDDVGGLLLKADIRDALGHLDEAGDAFRAAIRRNGTDAYARQAYGQHLLKAGLIRDGLAEWSVADTLFGNYPLRRRCPQWFGEPLGRRSLLVIFEHGLGDMIQMARFLPRLVATQAEARIVARVPTPLLGLFRRCFAGLTFVAEDGPEPDCDLFVPSMHLAAVLDADDLAPTSGYIDLGAPPRRADARPRIGICWRGAPRQYELTRSVPIATFATLFAESGADFVVLLNSLTAEETAALTRHPNVESPAIRDFVDLASLVGSCDLVVSVDTAIAHLAGAGGATTLLLSRPDSCWRWGAAGPRSPWYDTIEVLRHDGDMDWLRLLGVVADRIRALVPAATAA